MQRRNHVSLINIVEIMIEQASFEGTVGDWMGLLFLILVFLWTALIVPVFQTCIAFSMYLYRNENYWKTCYRTLSICRAWEFSGCLALCVVGSGIYTSQLSQGFLDENCNGFIETMLALLSSANLIDPEDSGCYEIDVEIEAGLYCFMLASLLCNVFTEALVSITSTSLHKSLELSDKIFIDKQILKWRRIIFDD